MSPSSPQGTIIWLTGLSGAGKTTIATGLEAQVRGERLPVCVLDGDELRRGVCSDLGFSAAERTENVRRVAEIARLIACAGVTVIVALISPFQKDRAQARAVAEGAGIHFIEVYLACPVDICERRDPKGLYKRARQGQVTTFTGIDSPYEAPLRADVVLSTSTESAAESVGKLWAYVQPVLPG